MRRILWAGLLALPLALAFAAPATAQRAPCSNCAGGGAPGGVIPSPAGWPGPHAGSPWMCGAFCFRLFATFHQDGPLVNYGPYSGYYPFEPYGPWGADMSYHGGGNRACGSLFHRGNSCGSGGLSMLKSVFHRSHPFARAGCSTCFAATLSHSGGCGGGCVRER